MSVDSQENRESELQGGDIVIGHRGRTASATAWHRAHRRLLHSLGAVLLVVLAAAWSSAPASAAYSPKLKRYPYLTNDVGTVTTVNWATDQSADTAVVKWGRSGVEPCTAHVASATRLSITVHSVAEYQWKATMTGLVPNSAYCYRVYLGSNPEVDLLGGDHSPTFQSQVQGGSLDSFKFAVFGDWGAVYPEPDRDQWRRVCRHDR
jgi:hypothetical protein